jgi:tRNA A-37 threonylcarbamoyl transferase component Bud32
MEAGSSPVATTLQSGAVFAGDYEIVEPLRVGGMGSVYVALQRSTGKRRALKVMLPQLVADGELRRRFEQEARIASLVESDHVVEVVGAGIEERTGVPWLAMELLEGMDLEELVERRGPMALDEATRVLQQLCHAGAAAHAAGIVHRDLKPENVFLSRPRSAGGADIVKVLDFGIAKIAVEAATKATAALGSPLWMAPEQTERGAVTPAADVWAIGLIGFFVLTGKVFWLSASSTTATLQQILREVLFEPIPLASERARELGLGTLPDWFDAWFSRCVVRDPSRRWQDAGVTFARFGADRVTSTAAPPRPVVVEPASSSRRLGAATRAALASGDTLAGGQLRESAWQPGKTETGRRRVARPVTILAAIVVAGLSVGAWRYLEGRAKTPVVRAEPAALALPPQLAKTPGAAWFLRVRPKCNPVEVELLVQSDPPPGGPDGGGFAAACLALAGKTARARSYISALPEKDRPFASWAVFEVVHPIADAGDDTAAGPAMALVLQYWPENYMALYHAGMSDYRNDHLSAAHTRLHRFVALHDTGDGFTSAARAALADMDRGSSSPPDCTSPIATDPEGRPILHAGCVAH